MNAKAFLNLKRTECVNYTDLKKINKTLREESLAYFKEKAVGQNLKEFESKILDDLQKKFLVVKNKCLQIYEVKCHEVIKKDVDNIESLIR